MDHRDNPRTDGSFSPPVVTRTRRERFRRHVATTNSPSRREALRPSPRILSWRTDEVNIYSLGHGRAAAVVVGGVRGRVGAGCPELR